MNTAHGIRCLGTTLALLMFARTLPAQVPQLYDEWRWVRFDLTSGLPSLQIINIIDPVSGDPWIHTANGVAWYDGFRWQGVTIDSVSQAEIGRGTVSEDSGGVLFVLPPHLYRVTWRGGKLLVPRWHGAPLMVRRALALPDRSLILQSDSALFLYRHDSTSLLPSPFQHRLVHMPDSPFGIIQTNNGAIWLNAPTGLYRWVDTQWRLWYRPSGDDYLTVQSIAESPSGDGAMTARLAVQQMRLTWVRNGVVRAETTDPGAAATSMDIAPNGTILATSTSGVLSTLTGSGWQQVDPCPIQMINVAILKFRANGDLWVGKEGGLQLCAVSSQRWTVLKSTFPPETRSVNELLLDADSTLWVGTTDGIVKFFRGKPPVRIDKIDGVHLGVVTALEQDGDGNIWVGSGANFEGAFRWDGKQWRHYGDADGLHAYRIHRIKRDRSGRPWFLCISPLPPGVKPQTEPGAFVLDHGKFAHFGDVDGLLDNRVYTFAEDSSGAYWFGTMTGLTRFKDGRWKHWTSREGLMGERIFTLAVDRAGRVWFGQQSDGLGYMDESDQPHYVTPFEGLTSRTVWEVEAGPDGKLWVATRDGLFVNNRGTWALIGTAEGLPNPYLWPLCVTPDRIYVGTTGSGVAVLQYPILELLPPRVQIADPVVRGSSCAVSWEVEAPWELVPSVNVKTRYRMDDQSWSEWSELRTVSLTGIGTGVHRFTVQSKGIIGQVSRVPQNIEIEIQPPLYLRPVFYGPAAFLIVLIVAALVYSVHRKREYDRTLREQDARFRAVVEHQIELILRLLPDGTVSFVNETVCRLLARARNELVGRNIADVLSGSAALMFRQLLDAAENGRTVEMDGEMPSPQGETRWLRWTSSLIPGDSTQIAEIQVIGHDITDRKAAEENLVRSEERYRIIAEQTGQLIYDYDIPSGGILWYGAISDVTGFSADEFTQVDVRRWEQMIHADDRAAVAQELQRCMRAGERFQSTYRFLRRNGVYIDVFDSGIFLKDAQGVPVRMLGTMTDITERQRAEVQIAASLKEKEVLLKEIHHRVKNNLQVISSLLNLQAANVADPRALEQLRESQNRIRSMALIHERLYQSDNLARIDFGEYIRSLVGYLVRSYAIPSVNVNVTVKNVSLPVNAAIPCGLIINELVSNALKYAFPHGRGGEVGIRLEMTTERSAVLTVQDNGVGLPRDVDFQSSTTLGLQLVNTLSKQLNGVIGLIRDRGTTFSIIFPVEV